MRRTVVMALAALTAAAQTQIDLRSQARGVDFTQASSTKPMKTGTELPAQCGIGEMFLKLGSPDGASVYACTAANTWTVQGPPTTVMSNGGAVGSRPALNYLTSPGLVSLISDSGSEIDLLWALDTTVAQTQAGEQSGAALYCESSSGSATNYQCSLNPTGVEYAAGMVLHWRPDVNGAGGATTLNVDTLGAKAVKLSDGISDPAAGDIVVGQLYLIWYDGEKFRLLTSVRGERKLPACVSTGSGGNYICSLTPPIMGYENGAVYVFRANEANSGAASIEFNGLGPKAIRKAGSQDLAANDIAAGQWVMLTYDGTGMQMLSPVAPGVSGAAPPHAATHQHGGSDEIAAASPAPNAIPKAGPTGKLDAGWLPDGSGSGGSTPAADYALVFDGTTTSLADGSTVNWTCGSGSGAQCTANWTVPSGVNWMRVKIWAGGGAGYGARGSNYAGAGGGGGGYAEVTCATTPGTAVSVAAGLGGQGTMWGQAPGAGGNSSFGACVTVNGGSAGTNSGAQGGALPGPLASIGFMNSAGTGFLNLSSNAPNGCHASKTDQGGCGGGPGAAAPGVGGGNAIGGGGGGGGGSNGSTPGGAGGASAWGGAGGNGGLYSGGAVTACTAGSVPGGGGGGAGAEGPGATNYYSGCAGARGEIRVYYTR